MLTWMAATVAGATTLMWNRSFVTLWVGPEHYAGAAVDILLVVLMFQTVFIRADAHVINATLDVRGRVLAGAFAAGTSIVLAILLIPRFHITGLCLGLAAGRLLQSVCHPVLVRRLLGRSRRTGWMEIARRLAVTTLIFLTYVEIGRRLEPGTWIGWLAGASACLVLTVALLWAAGIGPGGRRLLRRRASIILSCGIGPLFLRRLPS
jgi:O-antigen/teichoic acid export membrane protein